MPPELRSFAKEILALREIQNGGRKFEKNLVEKNHYLKEHRKNIKQKTENYILEQQRAMAEERT